MKPPYLPDQEDLIQDDKIKELESYQFSVIDQFKVSYLYSILRP
jgi:hypothetical protein